MSNFFRVRNGLNLSPVDLTTLTSPQAGDLACDINDSNKIKRYDANLLSWTEVGSGGVGNIDALLTQNFDNAALSQFTQTGLALVTSNTLNGSQTARLIHQSGSPQSFKQVISVDRKYRSQLMQLSLLLQSSAPQGDVTINIYDETNAANIVASEQLTTGAQAISGLATTNLSPTISGFTNAVINTLKVGERVTGSGIPTGSIINSINATALTVTISQNATATASGLTLNFSELPTRQVVSFVIPASCASLSYTVTALAEAGLPETYVDDVVIELAETALLETSVEVPVVTAWQGYTPTFQGFGSPSAIEFEWRQVGENIEIRGKFTAGTTTAVEARVGLPAGLSSANTSLIPSLQQVGRGSKTGTTTTYFGGITALIEPSVTYLTFGAESSSADGITKANASSISGSSNTISFFASVPCSGLSATSTKTIPLTQSGLVQEADSIMARQNTAFTANWSSGFVLNSLYGARFPDAMRVIGSDIAWSDSAATGSVFTVQKEGLYNISATATNSADSDDLLYLAVNTQIIASQRYGNGAGNNQGNVSASYYCYVGDIIRILAEGNNTIASPIVITRAGSLKQVSVNPNSKIVIPTSELRFEGASSRGSAATSIVRFDTQTNIRGDAFEVNPLGDPAVLGTHIRIRKAGRLSVNASVYAVNGAYVYLSKNQSVLTTTPTLNSEVVAASGAVAAGQPYAHVSSTFDVVVGDIIRVSSSAAISSAGNATFLLNLQEQQVAVSVTNVLPQFSESDSSVRVDTANGYGSTATKIRRFSNVRENVGSDINYVDSATEGSSFIARTSGIYEISYTENTSGTVSYFAISKNSSQLTTNPDGISDADRLALGIVSTAGYPVTISSQVYLVAGDVIRAHASGQAAGTNNFVAFRISKVGKPNVTGVNVTPFVNVPQPESQFSRLNQTASFGIATITGVLTENTNSGLFSYNSTTGIYTALKQATVTVSASFVGLASAVAILKNTQAQAFEFAPSTAGQSCSASATFSVQVGDTFSVQNQANTATSQTIVVAATALSEQILTAPETFSTDTASLQYAPSSLYNLTTLSDAPIGTYITFRYATANSNTRTQTTGSGAGNLRPSQTDADMNTNGILLYTRAYSSTSTGEQPAAIAIQIGKGMKGVAQNLYKSAGKVTAGSLDYALETATVDYGARIKDYNEVTGILFLDAGIRAAGITGSANFLFSDGIAQTSGYLVINAAKTPALTGIGLNRVAARAVNTAGTSVSTSGTIIPWDANKTYDTHGALNTTTGIFTVPETGYYQVCASLLYASDTYTNSSQAVLCVIVKNGTDLSNGLTRVQQQGANTVTAALPASANDILFLAKGDTVSVKGYNDSGPTNLITSANYNYFSIAKLSV
jgi:hypothetical protein